MSFTFSLLVLLFLGVVVPSFGDGTGEPSSTFQTDLDYAQVEFVVAWKGDDGRWRFDVTVRHNDEGWDHYADAWQVVDPDSGEVWGERILAHPHDNEQPFTRSQSGIVIPQGETAVLIRSRCGVHGFGGREVRVDLNAAAGNGYRRGDISD